MDYRYNVDLVAYDNDSHILISVTAEGDSTPDALMNAINTAKRLLKEDVIVDVNGYRPLDK